ncbi:hypothetical protein QBC35DRAFT_137420 [Podospora australis]|uniref:Uncharacterized protein n=1 Tax=Podospora australis TaxID=1536484 RepID=A0AAN6WYD6_9PEZI|nr:hypothetical protein QBC35DRAFT_137420 [Podospora australis]
MADKPPSTPIKVSVSASAANYTPATLDPQLRTDINSTLIQDGKVTEYASLSLSLLFKCSNPRAKTKKNRIQEALLHSLNSNQANWPTVIQTHALNLLRSGEYTTFPLLLRRVLDDIRQDTATAAAAGHSGENKQQTENPDRPSLVVPQEVIDKALKTTREKLEDILLVQHDGRANSVSVGPGGGGEGLDDDNNDNISARGDGSATPSGSGGGKK